MARFREIDVVRVKADHPAEGVKSGDLGAIVSVHDKPSEAYDVEFVDDDGRTQAILTLGPDDLEATPNDWRDR